MITHTTPKPEELAALLATVSAWQEPGGPVQLHPGDIGWFCRFGTSAASNALHVWRRDETVVAVALQDGEDVLRFAVDPRAVSDDELARDVADGLERDASLQVIADVEVRFGGELREELTRRGWVNATSTWTPLVLDLGEAPREPAHEWVIVNHENAARRSDLQRAAFNHSTFSLERWHCMAQSPGYANARCLMLLDHHGHEVAAATVWSAGEGRPGLLEPVGVDRDQRGHRYGTDITLAAARVLRSLGSSHATVCTRSENQVAVATYKSADFVAMTPSADMHREL